MCEFYVIWLKLSSCMAQIAQSKLITVFKSICHNICKLVSLTDKKSNKKFRSFESRNDFETKLGHTVYFLF